MNFPLIPLWSIPHVLIVIVHLSAISLVIAVGSLESWGFLWDGKLGPSRQQTWWVNMVLADRMEIYPEVHFILRDIFIKAFDREGVYFFTLFCFLGFYFGLVGVFLICHFFFLCLTKWWYGHLSKFRIICWLLHCLRTTGIHSEIRKTISCLDLFPFTWSFVLLFPFPCISFLSRLFWINAHLGPDCAIKALASITAWMESRVCTNRQSHIFLLDYYQY